MYWRLGELLGAVFLLFLAGDALCRLGSRALLQRRSDQQQIWRILDSWREHSPSNISAQEWNYRVIEVGIWANGLSENREVYGKLIRPDPLIRQNFRHELERLNQGPVTEQTLADLMQKLKETVPPPGEVECGNVLREMITPEHVRF